ncbi:hypothetical protein GCM10007203_19030 [Staphylococcus nepalensis]|nr:hypothetical protein GCM10007203_19030 [Staphylococcus nepalensis]
MCTSITNLTSKNRINKAIPVLNHTLLSIGRFLLKTLFEFTIQYILKKDRTKDKIVNLRVENIFIIKDSHNMNI